MRRLLIHTGNDVTCARTILRQLQLQAPSLREYLSKMKVRERADSHYGRYVSELQQMLPKLDSFMSRCSDAIAEAESFAHDDADDEKATAQTSVLNALYANAEHHLGGAKQARARYATY